MSTPAITYRSSGFNAQPKGKPQLKYQLSRNCPIQLKAYGFDQSLSIRDTAFPPAPKNTPATDGAGHATFGLNAFTPPSATVDAGNAILTGYSQPSSLGAGLLEFTASFSIVPASWNDFQSQTVNLPGWLNTLISGKFRDPKSVELTVRLQNDYFVIDPDGVLATAGILDSGGNAIARVANKGAIPIIRRTPWLATFSGAALPNDEAKALVPAAGVAGYYPTLPTYEQYLACCGVATTFLAALFAGGTQAWDASHPPAWDGASTGTTFGQFTYLNSRLSDYEGNIVQRTTTFALFE